MVCVKCTDLNSRNILKINYMEREILFRGKLKKDNQFSSYKKKNQWIYGGVANVKEKNKVYIFDNDEKTLYEVISETVCQFTGLTDKNGVRILS